MNALSDMDNEHKVGFTVQRLGHRIDNLIKMYRVGQKCKLLYCGL